MNNKNNNNINKNDNNGNNNDNNSANNINSNINNNNSKRSNNYDYYIENNTSTVLIQLSASLLIWTVSVRKNS